MTYLVIRFKYLELVNSQILLRRNKQISFSVDEVNCPNLVTSSCGFKNENKSNCYHLPQLNDNTLHETCVQGNSYDYFSNSPLSFILSFSAVGTWIAGTYMQIHKSNVMNNFFILLGTVGLVFIFRMWKAKENIKQHVTNEKKIRNSFKNKSASDTPIFSGKYIYILCFLKSL